MTGRGWRVLLSAGVLACLLHSPARADKGETPSPAPTGPNPPAVEPKKDEPPREEIEKILELRELLELMELLQDLDVLQGLEAEK